MTFPAMIKSVRLAFAFLVFAVAIQIDRSADGQEQGRVDNAEAEFQEGKLGDFLGEPAFSMSKLFETQRFPNIVVTPDGKLLAFFGNSSLRVRRSTDGGDSWGPEVVIAESGIHGGGATVDESSGDVIAFVEERHPPAPLAIYRSKDSGESWERQDSIIEADSRGNVPSMHMNEAGITLRHGKHRGRLIRAARHYAAGNRQEEWPNHYTTAIYSDDGGLTWKTSEPFAEHGTGEAAIAELSDGRLYYNSRIHWPEAERPIRRREAYSDDGGESWRDWRIIDVLPDGRQDRAYGCMGGLCRLPIAERDILVFSNLDTDRDRRERITAWVSFDGGKTWPLKRLVFEGPSGYSSIRAGNPDSPSQGQIYLHFEGGPGGASQVARFNLSWLLEGESTGDGVIPDWMK